MSLGNSPHQQQGPKSPELNMMTPKWKWWAVELCTSPLSLWGSRRLSWNWRCEVYILDAGASDDNLLGSTHGRFSCVVWSLSPQNQKTFSSQQPFQCNHHSKWEAQSSRLQHRVHLHLNICSHTCKLFSKDGGTMQWLSGLCLNTDIFASSSCDLHAGKFPCSPPHWHFGHHQNPFKVMNTATLTPHWQSCLEVSVGLST